MVYPGTHWLYYDDRHNYRARVDKEIESGFYKWRVLHWSMGVIDEFVGYPLTLEDAQDQAQSIICGTPFQLRII